MVGHFDAFALVVTFDGFPLSPMGSKTGPLPISRNEAPNRLGTSFDPKRARALSGEGISSASKAEVC